MPRRGSIKPREVLPDPVFQSVLVHKFINGMMTRGKKATVSQILHDTFEIIGKKSNEEPLKVFKQAVENTKPVLEVRSKRVGGANYQIPIEVSPNRRISLSIRWIVSAARSRSEKSMPERLASELLDAAANRGSAIKKKEDTHRMAEANKAFAHLRW
ncbi:MAG TPA: 30S ribosomal protein S7 [Acidobacteriota bacterium]|nr:30S ribosomal protein S7 [Acidobacteriota bacterium]